MLIKQFVFFFIIIIRSVTDSAELLVSFRLISSIIQSKTPYFVHVARPRTGINHRTKREMLVGLYAAAGIGSTIWLGKLATYPAFLTAPVQLNEAAAVPVCFALYGEFITLSPSSSSETAVVRDIRSSSEIWKRKNKKL